MNATSPKAVEVIKNSRIERILECPQLKEAEWDSSGGRVFKVYKDKGEANLTLRILTMRDKVRVEEARNLLAERISDNDVESSPSMLKLLSDSEQNTFAGGSAKYNLVALYSKDDKIIGAANSISWKAINVAMYVMIAVDEKQEGIGLGRLLNSESTILCFEQLEKPKQVRYVFGEMEPKSDTLPKIVRWFGGENAYRLYLPYPLPPLRKGARVSSLIPAFFAVGRETNPEMGMSDNETKSILLYIQQEFYRTTSYLEKVLTKFRDRVMDNRIQLKPMATRKQQEEAVGYASDIQKLFDNPNFWSEK